MSIREVQVKKNSLVARSSWGQRWCCLGGYYESLVIDLKRREIRNVECRFWRRHTYLYSLDLIEGGQIDVVSNFNSVEPKTGIESQVYRFSLSLFSSKRGWFELCQFTCTRTIIPDLWVFLFGWLPFIRRDSIDDGMEIARKVADYLSHHANIVVRFHGYTAKEVYDYPKGPF